MFFHVRREKNVVLEPRHFGARMKDVIMEKIKLEVRLLHIEEEEDDDEDDDGSCFFDFLDRNFCLIFPITRERRGKPLSLSVVSLFSRALPLAREQR